MQVYRGMDIGTAKITEEEQAGIPHHLIDIVSPDASYSVSEFQKAASEAIGAIHARDKLPFIVGGTGLYIQSLIYGYEFAEASGDEEFREELRRYAEEHGSEPLHERLCAVDPVSAARIHAHDLKRIIRALEIHHLTGETMSEQLAGQKLESPYETCIIGLIMDREKLYRRINERVDMMLAQGLVQEVQGLLEQGYARDLVSMQGIGYKQIIGYLDGEYTWREAVDILKRDTRRFAKRQLSWFRRMQGIHWVDVTETQNFTAHLTAINGIISEKFDQL